MRRRLTTREAAGLAGAGALLASSFVAVLAMTLLIGAATRALHVGVGIADRHSNRKRGKA